jgi:hypothetical protein
MSKYQDYANKPREFLALTGYTRTEFDALLPHFAEQFYEHMKQYRLDGKPRGKRKYSDYQNSPFQDQPILPSKKSSTVVKNSTALKTTP